MFLAARAVLLSMRASEDFGFVPNMLLASEDIKQKQNERKGFWVCWKLFAAEQIKPDCCRTLAVVSIFPDSAACVLSFYHSTPLHFFFLMLIIYLFLGLLVSISTWIVWMYM